MNNGAGADSRVTLRVSLTVMVDSLRPCVGIIVEVLKMPPVPSAVVCAKTVGPGRISWLEIDDVVKGVGTSSDGVALPDWDVEVDTSREEAELTDSALGVNSSPGLASERVCPAGGPNWVCIEVSEEADVMTADVGAAPAEGSATAVGRKSVSDTVVETSVPKADVGPSTASTVGYADDRSRNGAFNGRGRVT